MNELISFCEENNFGFSIARASRNDQFTVFIHTPILDRWDKEISEFSQSMLVDDAINMTIQKAKLLIKKQSEK